MSLLPPEVHYLTEELEALRQRKAWLSTELESVTAAESRVVFALDVVLSVVNRRSASSRFGTPDPMLNHSVTTLDGQVHEMAREGDERSLMALALRQTTLEQAILNAFMHNRDELMTSTEIVDFVNIFSAATAKPESVFSTLSRMTKKGLLVRDGRHYRRARQEDGLEVLRTSRP